MGSRKKEKGILRCRRVDRLMILTLFAIYTRVTAEFRDSPAFL
jgi:hypothetical protein